MRPLSLPSGVAQFFQIDLDANEAYGCKTSQFHGTQHYFHGLAKQQLSCFETLKSQLRGKPLARMLRIDVHIFNWSIRALGSHHLWVFLPTLNRKVKTIKSTIKQQIHIIEKVKATD